MSDRKILLGDLIPLRTKVDTETFYRALDPGIRFAVRVLHAHGIETCQSCESGPGHCYPEPTVDLLAGPNDVTGFSAMATLHAYGLKVGSLGKVWYVVDGMPYEPVWRITFDRGYPERADEELMFLWGYQAQHRRVDDDVDAAWIPPPPPAAEERAKWTQQ